MRDRRRVSGIVVACLFAGMAASAGAGPVYWADWASATVGHPGSAWGEIVVLGTGTVGIKYAGEVTSSHTAGTANYWLPAGTYTSSSVENAPSPTDLIALTGHNGGSVNTVRFSRPVTDPAMAILSLGSAGMEVRYTFDAPFDVVSAGPSVGWDLSRSEPGTSGRRGQRRHSSRHVLHQLTVSQPESRH
jgi:hypothetical protein